MKDFQRIARQYQLVPNSPFDQHANAIIREFYHAPYKSDKSQPKIARPLHGGQHGSRVALHTEVFTKLYRRYGDPRAQLLTDKQLEYLKIAALFHDAARENDGMDHWDKESAVLCFQYLVTVMGLSSVQAKIYAEAIANKDYHHGGEYHHLHYNEKDQTVTWKTHATHQPKSIEATIIQNADCLDVMRCYDTNYQTFAEERNMFDGKKLDFYQDIAQDNDSALYELGIVLNEARAMIHRQGDGNGLKNEKIKIEFEYADNCFIRTKQDAQQGRIYNQLCTGIVSSIDDQGANDSLLLNEAGSLQRDLELGNLLLRGIYHPSAVVLKQKNNTWHKTSETFAELELRKLLRTGEKKDAHNNPKIGNPLRSVTQPGYGSIAFSPSGYLIKSVPQQLQMVSHTDAHTGYGKKQHLKEKNEQVDPVKMKQELYNIHKKNMLSAKFSVKRELSTHSEILYHINKVDGIYFSLRKTHNDVVDDYNSYYLDNHYSAQLQALYIQQMHYIKTSGELLPIYSFDPISSTIKKTDISFKDTDKILELWKNIVRSYIEKNQYTDGNIYNYDLRKLKILACYGTENEHNFINRRETELLPLDGMYNNQTRDEIDAELAALIKLQHQAFLEAIESQLINNDCPNDECLLFVVYHNTELANKYLHKFTAKLNISFLDKPDVSLHDLESNVFKGHSASIDRISRIENNTHYGSNIHVLHQSDLVTYFLISKKINNENETNRIKNKIRFILNGIWDKKSVNMTQIIFILKTFDMYGEYETQVKNWLLAQEISIAADPRFIKANNLVGTAIVLKMDTKLVLDKITPILLELIKSNNLFSWNEYSGAHPSLQAFCLIKNIHVMMGESACELLNQYILKVCQSTFPAFSYGGVKEFFTVLKERHLDENEAIFTALVNHLSTCDEHGEPEMQLEHFIEAVTTLKKEMPSFCLKVYAPIIIDEFMKVKSRTKLTDYTGYLEIYLSYFLKQLDAYLLLADLIEIQNSPPYCEKKEALYEEINATLSQMQITGEKIENKKLLAALKKLEPHIDKALFEQFIPTKPQMPSYKHNH
jgi:hypothetical protein